MQHFTPISALIGGGLIGLSASLFLWLNGRIAGISGLFHGLFQSNKKELVWRLLFLIGLIVGGQIYYLLPQLQFQARTHYPVYILLFSGFLVGLGTKLSGGCTSGHGICGIARLSKRSLVATGLFFLAGIITVYLIRHVWRLA